MCSHCFRTRGSLSVSLNSGRHTSRPAETTLALLGTHDTNQTTQPSVVQVPVPAPGPVHSTPHDQQSYKFHAWLTRNTFTSTRQSRKKIRGLIDGASPAHQVRAAAQRWHLIVRTPCSRARRSLSGQEPPAACEWLRGSGCASRTPSKHCRSATRHRHWSLGGYRHRRTRGLFARAAH